MWQVLQNELVLDLDEHDGDCCSCRSELWWPVESTDSSDDDKVVNKMDEGTSNVRAGELLDSWVWLLMLPLPSYLMLFLWPVLLYELVGDLLWPVLQKELVLDLDEYDSD